MPQQHRRVVGYARVSSVEQAIGTSLQDQQEVITAYAGSRGLKVGTMFVESESAVHEKVERREQIRLLLSDVRRGDLVLVDKIDRWSRDPEFTYRTIRQILTVGASFYAVGDGCDPSTNEGDTMLNFRVLFAKEEHKRIKQRMVGTRRLLRDRGYYADGLPPWGYQRQAVKGAAKNVLVFDDEQLPTVRRVFELCLRGKSINAISEALNVHRDRIYDTLHNRIYLGEVRDGKGAWIRGQHQALIDADTFARAQDALTGRRNGSQPSTDPKVETATWWLRDVARCALCAAKMSAVYGGTPDRRNYYFVCAHRCDRRLVRVLDTEAACDPLVVARLQDLRRELSADDAAPVRRTVDAASIALKRDRLERKRVRYVEAFSDGAMTREEFRAAVSKLDTERTRLDAACVVPPEPSHAQRRQALESVRAIASAWPRVSPTNRRGVIISIARAVRLTFGAVPVFDWYTSEEIARWQEEER